MKNELKISIVEDDKDIRESLITLIASQAGFDCNGAYETAEAAIEGIPKDIPDIVLMDINLPKMNGVNAVRILKEKFPAIKFLMCTVFKDDENIFQSLQAGASGYILKSSSTQKIIDAINELQEGGAPMSATVARQVIESFYRLPKEKIPVDFDLTSREMEILQLLSKGLVGKEVAAQLGLSLQTIRNHCANIYEKLQVNTKTEAINLVFGKRSE